MKNYTLFLGESYRKMTDKEYIKNLKQSRDFYKARCELLQQVQTFMRDPGRQIVCDILANNALLPDPNGKRYGQSLNRHKKTS